MHIDSMDRYHLACNSNSNNNIEDEVIDNNYCKSRIKRDILNIGKFYK